jgi:lipoyl(octanoyl) transferase
VAEAVAVDIRKTWRAGWSWNQKRRITAYPSAFGQGFFHCIRSGGPFAHEIVAAVVPLPAPPAVRWLGRIDYATGLALQEDLAARHLTGEAADTILLLEHDPVFTIGRTPDRSSLRDAASLPAPLVEIGRGGKATWHGPGQLVGYPILNLVRYGQDLHRYLRALEEALIQGCQALGVPAERNPGQTGVWAAPGRKLASIGVGARRWISMHGFALNVTGDLGGFAAITPCGLDGVVMTSLEREGAPSLSVEAAAAHFAPYLLQSLAALESHA